MISTEERNPADAPAWAAQERRQREELLSRTHLKGSLGRTLTLAADQFLVSRGEGMSVIAGYPWFGDWGRDSLVSLPVNTGFTFRAALILGWAGRASTS